jgi:serine/threonine-protein kinase
MPGPDQDAKAHAASRLGTVLRGKYRLDRVLGVGGMAVVYAATHRNKKRVAIKMLHPELSVREGIRTRFLREGYVANSVDHPGAVAVLDDDVAEDGSAFIVMELLEGAPVDEVWARHDKRLPVDLAVSIGDALLDVLVAAHAKGIVHRDLKPANLFLTHDGRLEVLDFGIARLHDDTSAEATATGAMLGTPAFMAPEQALGESSRVDAQTDLWAVGATLFALLSGRFVHEGLNASQLLVAAATRSPASLASVAPELPAPVVAVVDRALLVDKSRRWPSAAQMREALRAACLEATQLPVKPLPRESRPVREPSLPSSGAASSDDAFAPTVDAEAKTAGRAASSATTATANLVASTRPPAATRWLAASAIAFAGLLAIAAAAYWQGKARGGPLSSPSNATAPSAPAPSAPASTTAPTSSGPSAYGAFYPCKDTNFDVAPADPMRACDNGMTAWCSRSGRTIACCSPELVAVDGEGLCGCPPGGSLPPSPCPLADAGGEGTHGRLEPTVIQKAVRAEYPRLRACVADASTGRDTDSVNLYFEISPNGEVFQARLKGTTLRDPSAQRCLLDVARAMRFPPPVGAGGVSVVYPLRFVSSDE